MDEALSLYIHLPWCVRKCPYCDFNSHAVKADGFPQTQYVDALLRDLEYELPRIKDRQINSIFFGGGTPSLFSAQALASLLTEFRAQLNLSLDVEITLEANPGTTDSQHFGDYLEVGINRLSIGVQSFNDEKLTALGRIHGSQEANKAIRTAQAAGFKNINIDIMFALPEQTVEQALDDIRQAIDNEPTHISWYQLTIEPNTVFYSQPPSALPEDELVWDMQEQGQSLLSETGYHRYEVSAYSKKDRQCRHNLNYWQFGDYCGLGAGAHGKISDIDEGVIERFARHRVPQSYIERAGEETVLSEKRQIQASDIPLEFMMNALRLTGGFPERLFEQTTGVAINHIEHQLSAAQEQGFLQRQSDTIRPTIRGSNYLNDLLQIFMLA